MGDGFALLPVTLAIYLNNVIISYLIHLDSFSVLHCMTIFKFTNVFSQTDLKTFPSTIFTFHFRVLSTTVANRVSKTVRSLHLNYE